MNIIPKEIELQNYAEEFLFQHCLRDVIDLDKTFHTEWDLPYKYKGKKSSEKYYGKDRYKVYYAYFTYNHLADESSTGDFFDEVDWNPLYAFVKTFIERQESEDICQIYMR